MSASTSCKIINTTIIKSIVVVVNYVGSISCKG